MYKKIITIILCCLLFIGNVAVASDGGAKNSVLSQESVVASGSCGENVVWTCTGSKSEGYILTISGKGDMYDYDSYGTPWYKKYDPYIRQDIRKVIVEEGITSIGAHAFDSLTKVSSVEIGESVKKIGNSAFFNCQILKSINIPEACEEINEAAFWDCKQLQQVTLSKGLKNIRRGAFAYCDNLREITIPKNVEVIGKEAFEYCKNLSKVTILDGVSYIGDSAFYQCENLQSVSIGQGTVAIEDGAFMDCKKLQSISIPDSVISIGYRAFYNCDYMISATIPESVTDIGINAFWDCPNLIIYGYSGSRAEEYAKEENIKFVSLGNKNKPITGVSLNRTSLSLTEGDSASLSATIYPSDTTDSKAVTWSSSNTSVATVDSYGRVTAKGEGTAYITVTTSNGMSADCRITVQGTSSGDSIPFTDVSSGEWYYDCVKYVYTNQFMTGLNNSTFGAGELIARAQFAVILHRMNDKPKVAYTNKFPDVAEGLWYTDAILWANSTGVVNGYSNTGLFGVADNINREQMAVMMYRYAGYKKYNTDKKADFDKFADAASVNGFAKDAMRWAVGTGIITGKTINGIIMLEPQGSANRAECATIIMRFVQNYSSKDETEDKEDNKPSKPVLEEIVIKEVPRKLQYEQGEKLDLTGMVVTAIYSDGSTTVVTNKCSVSGYDGTVTGKQTITISYENMKATFEVVVNATEEKPISRDIQIVSLGATHSAVVMNDGSLWMWGKNKNGEYGNGTTIGYNVLVKIMDDVKIVEAGNYFTAVVKKDGSLWTCGYNGDGQLGNGTVINQDKLVKIMDNVKSVSLGQSQGAAIKNDGSLWMWGWNCYGQLGDGTTADSNVPIKIMDDVQSVSLGSYHSAAIKKDGSLWMWGYNSYGQLGNGTTTNSNVPIRITENVKEVSLGAYHSTAVKNDNTLWTWGKARLGNGTNAGSNIPVKIMDDVISVKSGGFHSAVIKRDGSLWTWGGNSYGCLGDGTQTDRDIPVKIMDNVAEVALSNTYHSAAIKEDGSLWMWGYNSYGQLGDETTESKMSPVNITDYIVKSAL